MTEQTRGHPPLTDKDLAGRFLAYLSKYAAAAKSAPALILPPDLTRIHSRAGLLTGVAYRFFADVKIMPALGTHRPLSPEEIARMFPDCPPELFIPHRWREDTVELGRLPADWVEAAFCGQGDENNNAASPRVHSSIIALATWGRDGTTDIKLQQWLNAVKPPEGRDSAFHLDWPVQVNRLLLKNPPEGAGNPPPGQPGDSPSGGTGGNPPFSLIVSIGQVVPHEIAGMANHAKNIFVGTGGAGAIHKSHWLGALYGLERLMGQAENPVRRLFDEALRRYGDLLPPILWVLTVVDYHNRVRGFFCGFGRKCFEDAAALAAKLNIERVSDQPGGIRKAVVWLDPEEYRSTWLGNKAIYRTRRALAEGGELLILAPGLDRFGEDPALDALIRRYGYRGTEAIRRAVEAGGPLAENLSAAAHLIHGSGEGRFTIRYCTEDRPGGRPDTLDRAALEAAGYVWGDLEAARARYMPEGPDKQNQGWNRTADGEPYYFIRNPALGLWVRE